MVTDIRQRFADIAARADDKIPVDEAALLIAAEADPEMPVEHYMQALDTFASDFQRDSRFGSHMGIQVNPLINYIHNDLGFSGNVSDYYDPANSYLNRVIDGRRGIPISLALIHLSIGFRLEIPVTGISFPGHFLIRYGESTPIIVDPFSGRELSRADCQNLLRQIAGPRATLQEDYFTPASPREILIRMLDNLKQIFWRAREWEDSKACIDRQLLLLPERKEFNIQLGAIFEMQGNTAMAQHSYTRVLETAAEEKLKDLASRRLLALENDSKVIH